MSNIKILGLPNHTAQPYMRASAADAAYEPAEMGVDFLKTEEPSDRARVITLDPLKTQWSFESRSLPLTYDGFALVNHNLYPGSQVRWIGNLDGSFPFRAPLRLAPNAILTSSNFTGINASVDEEISASDGVYVGPTSTTSAWFVRFGFGALSATPHTGADRLCFVLRMRRQFVGAGATNPRTAPTVFVRLYEAGVLRRTLGHRAVSSTSSQVLIFPFSVADFVTTSGADLECDLEVTSGSSPSGSSYAQLDTLSLHYENASSTGFDSGWVTFQADPRPAPSFAPRYVHYFPPVPWTLVTGYAVLVRSDQAVHDPPITTGATVSSGSGINETPEGAVKLPLDYVDAGVSVAGVGATPEVGIMRGSRPSPRVEVVEFGGTTSGGQSYGADSLRRLVTDPMDLIVSRDELSLLQDQLAYRRGRSGGFYIAMEPNIAATYQAQTAMWCTLKEMSAPTAHGRYKADGSMRFKITVSFAEKL